jgi:hypothetical protein
MAQVDFTNMSRAEVVALMLSASRTDEELYNRCVRELNLRRYGLWVGHE